MDRAVRRLAGAGVPQRTALRPARAIRQGQKAVGVTVVYADATTDEFSFSTDAEFLRQALEEQKLVEGEESQYGLYVKTVNGVTADEAKEEWWCFTKDGEDVMTGVDSTPVADGDHFEITLKTGY